MSKITYSTQINRPPHDVFRYLDDPQLAMKWLDTLIAVEPLQPGPNRLGAKARHTYREHGREFSMIEETVVYEPDRRVKFQGETNDFHLTVDYTLTPVSGGTRIDYVSEVKPRALLMRLMLPFIRGMMKGQLVQRFEKLKALLEETPIPA